MKMICFCEIVLNIDDFYVIIMLHNIKIIPLHRVFHGIRFKVNEDWESGKIPSFFCPYVKGKFLRVRWS